MKKTAANNDPDYQRVQSHENRRPNSQEVEESRKEFEREQKKIALQYKQLFNSELGQIVYKHMRKEYRAETSCFTPGGPDGTRITDFYLGRQSVIFDIDEKLKTKG